ncbi:L,D-transpeptidase family protein [Halospina sp. K52047b]|uniref:L,D-transpeptidase family protein n=1 Tax=Halospina sp. K52047b TaxID=2614160 RepID=UPI00124A866D|nr:L,D-transpeptidase family protein [Halospina sp. K52047b]KAA8982969.1 L,D-transpeptidase family protein [Halospina sp. K52047b]
MRRSITAATVLVFLLPLIQSFPATAISDGTPHADRVLVIKSERRLYLIRDGKRIESFRVSLGQEPEGHKLFAGDNRTPEGQYTLDWRNPESDYYRSIHISYPNSEDRRKARAWGQDPGGNIMIHGLPNDADKWNFAFEGLDWTDGCIAVNNRAMDEIWRRVTVGTPIEIRP